jgi:hypothetical protein
MGVIGHLKTKWNVGPWGFVAILAAFSLAGMTVVRLKKPLMSLIIPDDAPGWVSWVVYLLFIMPLYHVLLLAYGALLGQFDFFWKKFTAVGRRLAGLTRRQSG